MNKKIAPSKHYGNLINSIEDLLQEARQATVRAVNTIIVQTYWKIGQYIVEFEQTGKERAEYGSNLLASIASDLSQKFGKGFSYRNLRQIRQFYLTFSNWQTVSANSQKLSWSHFVRLLSITNDEERSFYLIESRDLGWSVRELDRQINTALYERLALSKDKEGIKQLASKGQVVEEPIDALKDPYILEFLDLPEHHQYSESYLETAIITNLQMFLLELGKGFTFVARQRRISSGKDHYFIDLVLYNRLLRCFVLVDLKIGKLKHQDIGQMQMYTHWFDREVKTEMEHPTIGLILCKEKDTFVVEYTLPEGDKQIFASEYKVYLPSKAELKKELRKMIDKKIE